MMIIKNIVITYHRELILLKGNSDALGRGHVHSAAPYFIIEKEGWRGEDYLSWAQEKLSAGLITATL